MKRLTIFAHHDIKDDVEEYIFYHLEHLRRHSQQLIFVSNSPVSEQVQYRLCSICDSLCIRPNVGYDFAAWRDVILSQPMDRWEEILLTNSSVIGPLFCLSSVFNEMGTRKCDFWGLTHSINTRPHIQSYFVAFRRPVVESDTWREFWNSVGDVEDKWDVIRQYEVQFKQYFEAEGFRSDTLIPQMNKSGLNRIGVRRFNTIIPIYIPIDKNRTNPTIHSPLELIERGLPYLKASLLWGHNRRQPFPLKKIMALKKVDYDWNLVGLERNR